MMNKKIPLERFLDEQEEKELLKKLPKGQTPFWEHWTEYVTSRQNYDRSMVTVVSVRSGLRVIARHTGILTILQLNNHILLGDKLMDLKQQRGQAQSTRNTYIKNVNTYLKWLKSRDYINENNATKIEKAADKINEQETLSEQQIHLLRSFLITRFTSYKGEASRDTLFFEIMVLTGARTCEILDMRIDSVYLDPKDRRWKLKIHGRKQKGRIRYYPITPAIKSYFDSYLEHRSEAAKSDLLFLSVRSGLPLSRSGMQCLYKRVSKQIGFSVSGHRIRRYVATRLNTKGLSLNKIADYLGHTRETTTKRYIERSCILTQECAEHMATTLAPKTYFDGVLEDFFNSGYEAQLISTSGA